MRKSTIGLLFIGALAQANPGTLEVSCPHTKHLFTTTHLKVKCTAINHHSKAVTITDLKATGCKWLDHLENAKDELPVGKERNLYLDCDLGHEEYVDRVIKISAHGIGYNDNLKPVGSITGNISKDCKK